MVTSIQFSPAGFDSGIIEQYFVLVLKALDGIKHLKIEETVK